jgi:hypothetical protein
LIQITALAHALPLSVAEDLYFMFSTNIKNLFKGFALVSAMTFGVMLVSTSTTSAQQYPNYGGGYGTYGQRQNQDDRYNGRDRNGNQSARFAYQRGYKEGLRQARQDVRNGSVNSRYGQYGSRGTYGRNDPYSNNGSYGRGNHNGWGNSSAFQQAYREGYDRGYNEGMSRFSNNRRYNNNNRYDRARRIINTLPY